MSQVELKNTKQRKQIGQLRHQLKRFGWVVVEEVARKFKGKPKWETNDEYPNLIYSWAIHRKSNTSPVWIDFIANWDYFTYETFIGDCSHCLLREKQIELYFTRDKSLRNNKEILRWRNKLSVFIRALNETELEDGK